MNADEPEEIVRTGFVTTRIRRILDFLLRHELRTEHVVPAINRRPERGLAAFADIQETRGTGTEHPFVGVGRKKIDLVHGGGKGADGLDSVHARMRFPAVADSFRSTGNQCGNH